MASFGGGCHPPVVLAPRRTSPCPRWTGAPGFPPPHPGTGPGAEGIFGGVMPPAGRSGPPQHVALSALDGDLAVRLGPELASRPVRAFRVAPGRWSGVPADAGLGVLVAR